MLSRLCFSAISKYYSLYISEIIEKFSPVWKVEILQVTVNKSEVYYLFMLISKSAENSQEGYLGLLLIINFQYI